MKLFQRLLISGSLMFLIAGFSLAFLPASYAAEKRPAMEEQKEQGYVASREGDKYHKTSCRVAKKIKAENRVAYKSKAEAEKDGKRPCGICKP